VIVEGMEDGEGELAFLVVRRSVEEGETCLVAWQRRRTWCSARSGLEIIWLEVEGTKGRISPVDPNGFKLAFRPSPSVFFSA
jgi:hypothetical protein